jgi:hypothetical protein
MDGIIVLNIIFNLRMIFNMYTITISNLDNDEADHISSILSDYKRRMLEKKLEAIVEDHKDGGNRVEWFDKHLMWHESIMKKVKWLKE